MSLKLRKTAITERVKEYWEKRANYDCYIEELLGQELLCASEDPINGSEPRLKKLAKPVHTLALTVGESFEPLLQVVCALRPKRIVLILNQQYPGTSGKNQGNALKGYLKKLGETKNIPEEYRPTIADDDVEVKVIEADTPTAVFRALLEAFRTSKSQPPDDYTNAVDITGAKKSMVAGAFLFAAHSGLPITYVDFDADAYDKDFHRPYGHKCRIGQIADPYAAYQLREWERVRQLYNRYDFRGARELLETVAHVMGAALEAQGGMPLFNEIDILQVQALIGTLHMYETWDSGDYKQALTYKTPISPGALPDAVTQLGADWFEVTGATVSDGPPDFYGDQDKLKVYAFDELKRIGRLIEHNQDYRSAFLRAGGLSEVLMTARLVREIDDPSLRSKLLAALTTKTPNSRGLFLQLCKAPDENIRLDKLGLGGDWPEKPTLKKSMNKWWDSTSYFKENDGWQKFLDLRNSLAHRYVSVPRDLAEDALKFVSANFDDFFDTKNAEVGLNTAAIPWSNLCTLFDLDFLPPQLRNDT
jgi:hypothetical protein